MSALGHKRIPSIESRRTPGVSDWLLKVTAPFWPEPLRYIGRAIDLTGLSDALHWSVAAARIGLGSRGFCCWRQVRRNDLLWLAQPALSTNSGAALLDSDEATVGAA